MQRVIGIGIAFFLKLMLAVRYRVTIKGLEHLTPKNLNKPGGVIFLPNHPTIFVDPVLIIANLWRKFHPHPVVVEYMFYKSSINWLMRLMRALPMPDVSTGGNSFKRHRVEKSLQGVIQALKNKENVVVYPGGRVKLTAYEALGATSGVHKIIEDVPEANVVLVRIKGLWGSSFSRAITGKNAPMFEMIWRGVKIVFANLLFFTPRRDVIIEFTPAPADFPWKGSRLDLNNYLEDFYNQPDGLAQNPPGYKGESLVLVPYYFWSKKTLDVAVKQKSAKEVLEQVDFKGIPESIQQQVIGQIATLAEKDPTTISPAMDLATDLGLDSLDTAELISFLESQYDVKGVSTEDLNSVGKVIAIAAGKVMVSREVEEEKHDISKWMKHFNTGRAALPEGKTIPEVFLNACDRSPNSVACADGIAGILTYKQLKMRVLIMAEFLSKMPEKNIGIMLPSSVGAMVMVLGCLLAGKVPVMINWTVGPRHFDAVAKLSGIKQVLSSWRFIDRLENIELGILDDRIFLLEDLRGMLSLKDKWRAWRRSKKSAENTLKIFGIDKEKADATAVILFTSGSESMPKGVPLSHENILCNLRAAMDFAKLDKREILYSILPPFHSFGFSVTGLLPLLCGIRVVYSPDPNDSLHLAHGIQKWNISLLCGAPTFLKSILKSAEKAQVKTLKLLISGAEKPSEDLIRLMKELNSETEMIEGYGITECSPVLTMNPIGEKKVGVGKPLPGVELLIVHPETLAPLPTGNQGMILARGPNVFKGYLGNAVASPFVQVGDKEWYQTGDLGMLDSKGNLTISGRLKRFVKIGGEMISLMAVEDALLQAAAKNGWPKKEEGPPLAVSVEEKIGEKPRIHLFTTGNIDTNTVNQALRAAGFSNLVKVSSVIKIDEIPLMGTGKIHYRQLDEMYLKKLNVQQDIPFLPPFSFV